MNTEYLESKVWALRFKLIALCYRVVCGFPFQKQKKIRKSKAHSVDKKAKLLTYKNLLFISVLLY